MIRASHRTVTALPKPKKVHNNLGRTLIKKGINQNSPAPNLLPGRRVINKPTTKQP